MPWLDGAQADQAEYLYDALGRLSAVVDGQGNAAIYTYDAAGNLLAITRGVVAAPAITGIAPAAVDAGGSVSVTISGSGLALARTVTSSNPDIVAGILRASETMLTVSLAIPNPTAFGPTTLTVTTLGGTASTTLTVRQPTPTVTQLTPTIGGAGTRIVIEGRGFSAAPGSNHVTFAGSGGSRLPATVVREGFANLTVEVPTGVLTGLVTVEVGGVTSNGLPFTVQGLSSIIATATQGIPANAAVPSANQGQTIQLVGGALNTFSQATFTSTTDSGVQQTVSANLFSASADGTTAFVQVPQMATTGPVTVDGRSFVFLQIVPTAGDFIRPPGGETTLQPGILATFTGIGFKAGATTVTFPGGGPSPATAIMSAGSQLNVRVPAGITGGVVTITTDGGTSNGRPVPELRTLTATAAQGTPANASMASANIGQTLQLQGLQLGFLVTNFFKIDFSGTSETGAAITSGALPQNASADGTTATVTVPSASTTGPVKTDLFGSVGSPPLQIVPTVTGVSAPAGQSLQPGVVATISGTGFKEGATQVLFPGASGLAAATDVFTAGGERNNRLTVTVPPGATAGVLTVQTDGGVSNAFQLASFQAIVGTSAEGTPANPGTASANAGQIIQLQGSGFSTSTAITFPTTDDAGVAGNITTSPIDVTPDGTTATVIVPFNATTGTVTISGFGSFPLQIVPTGTFFQVPFDETYHPGVVARLFGSGFKEGTTTLLFPGASGPIPAGDVSSFNTQLTVTIPAGATAGPLTVHTDGGTSKVLPLRSPTLTAVTATAVQGSPRDAGQPSANVNQSVTITGSDFGDTTLVLIQGFYSNGNPETFTVGGTASPDGTSLTITIPFAAVSGPITVQDSITHLGTGSAALQVVPTVSAVSGSFAPGSQAIIMGAGFDPAGTQVQFPGVADPVGADPDSIRFSQGSQATVTVPAGVDTTGDLTLLTPGGLSNPASLAGANNREVEPNDTPATANPLAFQSNPSGVVSASKLATIDPPGDVNVFGFDADVGHEFEVRLVMGDPPGPMLTLRVTWLDQDGATVLDSAEGPVGGENNDAVSLFVTIPSTGTYFVKVEELSGQGGPADTYGIVLTDLNTVPR